jgi:hypothetical protein
MPPAARALPWTRWGAAPDPAGALPRTSPGRCPGPTGGLNPPDPRNDGAGISVGDARPKRRARQPKFWPQGCRRPFGAKKSSRAYCKLFLTCGASPLAHLVGGFSGDVLAGFAACVVGRESAHKRRCSAAYPSPSLSHSPIRPVEGVRGESFPPVGCGAEPCFPMVSLLQPRPNSQRAEAE